MVKKAFSYGWLILSGCVCWLLFCGLNKTLVIGRRNIPRRPNVLIIANHLTMLDSWVLSLAWCWPAAILEPWRIPANLPEQKNFMKTWWQKILGELSRCIPLNRGTGDFLKKLPLIASVLRRGAVMVFPEGTRSRRPKSGCLYQWKPGAARLAYETNAKVVPIAIRGIEEVLPIGSVIPRIGKKIIITIGKPIDFSVIGPLEKHQALAAISELMRQELQDLLNRTTRLYHKTTPHL